MTLVCFAVPQECRFFQGTLRKGTGIEVVLTGIGPRNAQLSITRALDALTPQLVISSGFSGALVPGIGVGTLVFDRLRISPDRARVVEKLGARPVSFFHSERIATTAKEKIALGECSGCDAVEMESEAIQRICAARGIECLTLRAISDMAVEDLPLDFNALMTSEQRLSSGKLALAIVRSPRVIPGLWRLGRNSALAARQLGIALNALLSSH